MGQRIQKNVPEHGHDKVSKPIGGKLTLYERDPASWCTILFYFSRRLQETSVRTWYQFLRVFLALLCKPNQKFNSTWTLKLILSWLAIVQNLAILIFFNYLILSNFTCFPSYYSCQLGRCLSETACFGLKTYFSSSHFDNRSLLSPSKSSFLLTVWIVYNGLTNNISYTFCLFFLDFWKKEAVTFPPDWTVSLT